jgi:hypothetical protein
MYLKCPNVDMIDCTRREFAIELLGPKRLQIINEELPQL